MTIPRGKITLLVTEQEEANAAKQRPSQRSCAVSMKDSWKMRLAELRVVVNNWQSKPAELKTSSRAGSWLKFALDKLVLH